MRFPISTLHGLCLLAIGIPATAQIDAPALALRDAVREALERHPSIEAAAAQVRAAGERTAQARAGYRPRVSYAESFQTSNNPVFAFGTLLTQRRFAEANFAIDALNHPGFVNNFQSAIGVDQLLYDFGGVRAQVRSAGIGEKLTVEQERQVRMRTIARVVAAYFGAALAQESLKVARKAVESAEADVARAEASRAAGMSTDADVLSIRVHLAAMREREIERGSDLTVARAALNEALGRPLDTEFSLATPLAAGVWREQGREAAETGAQAERPETRQSRLAVEQAETEATRSRLALYPRVLVRAAFEADRGRFVTRAGANWYFGASLQWTLFNGADRSRIAEASHALAGAKAREREAAAGVRLDVRRAHAAQSAARQRIEVASAAVAQAEESLRIVKNRYQAGLATVTDLLRNETALLEAGTRRLAAIHDHRVAAAMLELAAGTLSGDSDVLQ